MLRRRLKYASIAVSFLAVGASIFSGATVTAVVLLCSALSTIFIDWGKAIDAASLTKLIEALHPNAHEIGGATESNIRGYHANWVAIVTTTSTAHVIFRDEVSATEWRELITRLKHGSVLRAKPRQTTNRLRF
jgi:hypothetical protein